MDSQNSSINEGCEGQIVEYIAAVAPHVSIAILADAFVVEAVYLSNLSALVVSADQGNPVRITDLIMTSSLMGHPHAGTLRAKSSKNVSTLLKPRSTKSPGRIIHCNIQRMVPRNR